MAALGPLVHVIFRPSPTAVRASGLPTGERVAMLIDTGAVCTMVDDRTARRLGHEPDYFTLIGGAIGTPESRPVYQMEMMIRLRDAAGMPHDVSFRQEIVGLQTSPERGLGFGLIGRDALSSLRFVYDGPRGAFSLTQDHTDIV